MTCPQMLAEPRKRCRHWLLKTKPSLKGHYDNFFKWKVFQHVKYFQSENTIFIKQTKSASEELLEHSELKNNESLYQESSTFQPKCFMDGDSFNHSHQSRMHSIS